MQESGSKENEPQLLKDLRKMADKIDKLEIIIPRYDELHQIWSNKIEKIEEWISKKDQMFEDALSNHFEIDLDHRIEYLEDWLETSGLEFKKGHEIKMPGDKADWPDVCKQLEKTIDRIDSKVCFALNTVEEEIKKLQQSREAHTRNHTSIFERLDELKEYIGSYPNKEMIKKLEINLLQNDGYCVSLEGRIEKLEELTSEKYAHPDVISRIERLESRTKQLEHKEKIGLDLESFAFAFNDTMDKYDKKIEQLMSKDTNIELIAKDIKPHKCPVCDGDGTYREDGKIYSGRHCNVCEGKGVLWG